MPGAKLPVMRTAIFDIGSNSTRVYVADVTGDGGIADLYRESRVTRLAANLERVGSLEQAAIARVTDALDSFGGPLAELRPERSLAILTSAVRDAANGSELTSLISERYGLEARLIAGPTEAALTFAGATHELGGEAAVLVIDIGGGSTELIVGTPGARPVFAASLQAGVVRQGERHLVDDPPRDEQLLALREDLRALLAEHVPRVAREAPLRAIAVAGTATSAAAIDQGLDPYDPARVHGHVLDYPTVNLLLARLAAVTLEERRRIKGLHPDRAPTIVAGLVMLIEILAYFELPGFTTSEHDILRGVALIIANGDPHGLLDK
ncbi:MAG: Ppx/GppA phosphatase family protein [Solirubrobacteraceae bacterium]